MNGQDGGSMKPGKLIFNLIYFGLLFLILAFLHVYSVLLAANFSASSPFLFVLHAVIQAGLEAGILAYIAAVLERKGWSLTQKFFIAGTVIICILHFIDFHLVRLMDLSIWYGFDFILDESWRNFLELLIASTVPFTKIMLGIVLLSAVLFIAVYFFIRSQAFVEKKNLRLRPLIRTKKKKAVLCAIVATLGVFEYSTIDSIGVKEYDKMSKALPLKRLFFSPTAHLKIPCQLKPTLQEKDFQQAVAAMPMPEKKPNIFIFVIETLREEFLTQQTAPNLTAFKENNIFIRQTKSSSNTTPISWFSLFFSQSPLHFGEVKKARWGSGCPTVQILKKAGYKVHLYSASRLTYYEMDQMLFGENYHLADDSSIALPSRDHPAWQCDKATLAKLCADVQTFKEEEGHLFVTFIESTHFDYSWPKEQEKTFAPYCEEINFFKAACLQENITRIQNRYRNSIHYIDGLMGEVFASMDKAGRMDDSVIVVTADHGEEFFEEGNLFHASGLSQQQISVPLYCRFGEEHMPVQAKLASHVDVLPSLLHHLYGEEVLQNHLQGESIFREERWPFIVTGRYNGCRSPHEFLVQSDTGKILHAKFSNPSDPSKSRSIHILDYKDTSSQFLETTPTELEKEFGDAFNRLFNKI